MDQQATKSRPNGSLIQPPPEAEAFYSEVLQLMAKSYIPFLLSGTYAQASYTGIDRPTKDVDVFAKALTSGSPNGASSPRPSTTSRNTSAAINSAAPTRCWKSRLAIDMGAARA